MDDNTPSGERGVFNMLLSGPDDWVAIHSLDLAPWNRRLRTEIDFLVIIPDTGLLCIEVKSHDAITFENDRWYPPDLKRSPFKQALDARHTFFRGLRDLAPQFKHVPVVHICIFPRARFDVSANLSVQPWELIDSRVFRAFKNANDFCEKLKLQTRKLIEVDDNLHELPSRLSSVQVETIVRLCLPLQKRRADDREEIERHEQELDRVLREQQKPILQLAATNDRLLVTGAAGTGKTLMAMEVAKRAAERGRRVALLCFNQLVGEWLSRRVAERNDPRPNLIVGRAIRVMAEMTGLSVPSEPPHGYWDNEFTIQVLERLTEPEFEASAMFDFLVVDEAQDILARPRLWECLTGFLRGGVADGSFCLFGDLQYQVISAREALNRSLADLRTAAKPSVYPLTENCRNYRIIGESAIRLSGLDGSIYEGYMRAGGSVQNYDIFFYSSEGEQKNKLRQWLKDFTDSGYRPSEITVLSFRTADQSAAAKLAAEGIKIRPAWQMPKDAITYASVHAFKGLENKVIILTDVVLESASFHRDLFYTGMTRACESLRILSDSGSQATLTKWLVQRTLK